jgi:hypothetical protein
MKKTVSFLLVLCFVLSLCGLSHAQSVYADKKNTVALKAGYHITESSDFTDFWHVDNKDYNAFVGEISYERKFTSYLGIEAAGGFFSSSKFYANVLLASDNLDTRFTNFYISPSLKAYLPIKNLCLYIGAGPDYYYTVGKIKYNVGSLSYNDTKTFNSFGYHGLIGIEYVFYKNPEEDNFYDAPVSFLIEYKYSKVTISDADEDAIDYINSNLGTSLSKHDLEAGGHNIMAGLRWHF